MAKALIICVAGMSSSLMAQKQQIILKHKEKTLLLKQSVQTKGNV